MIVGKSYFCEHVKEPTAGECFQCKYPQSNPDTGTQELREIRELFIEAAVDGDLTIEKMLRFPEGTTILLNRSHTETLISNLIHTRIAAVLDRALEAMGDVCPPSERVNGKKHSWKFDGDDPNVICHYCGEVRRTGMVIVKGKSDPVKDEVVSIIQALRKEVSANLTKEKS